MEASLLEAAPDSPLSWSFDILRPGGDRVARLEQEMFRERAAVVVEGEPYVFRRTSVLGGTFALEHGGETVATAAKRSAFRRTIALQHGEHAYELRARSVFRRTMLLYDGSSPVGSVRPLHVFTRRSRIELPAALPLPLQVFAVWLVMVLWRRQRRSE